MARAKSTSGHSTPRPVATTEAQDAVNAELLRCAHTSHREARERSRPKLLRCKRAIACVCLTPQMSREQTASLFASRARNACELDSLVMQGRHSGTALGL